ncbi:dephospho-CoA kinase-domain-containing protein [Morchella snyderi]|nr:dephospho-CoA kinase-domain-containing protein [Morchella snyderi]
MLLIGLTGSIATGKSTASRILAAPPHNLPIIDADVLARTVVLPGTRAHARIVAHFSATTPDLLNPDGTLNRPALGRRVFGAGEERARDRAVLNGITHPAVRWEMYKQLLHHYLRGHWAVVLDVPLLFEARLDVLCGAVLVVAVSSPDAQLERLLARDAGHGLTREEAEGRVAAQMPLVEKVALCEGVYGRRGRGVVVRNDAGVEELRGELGRVVERLAGRRGGAVWWRVVGWVAGPVVGVGVLVGNLWGRWRWGRGGGGLGVKAKL